MVTKSIKRDSLVNGASLTEVNLDFFDNNSNVTQLGDELIKKISFYHCTILNLLGVSSEINDYNISKTTQFLINETSDECGNIVFRDKILWNKGITKVVTKSLYTTLQKFKNINISEYYHLIYSLIAYIETSEGELKDKFNIKDICEDLQLRGNFNFLESLLDAKLTELYFILDWSDNLINKGVPINEAIDLSEIENILGEVREIIAISGLIIQISSKNIGITDNVIAFFDFLTTYQAELSTFTLGLSAQLIKEDGENTNKLQYIGLLILYELKLIQMGNSHLLDYSKLSTSEEVREKYKYQLSLMESGKKSIEGTSFEEDKRFMFLKENDLAHKAKMNLQFCDVMDTKKTNNKYVGINSYNNEDQFTLSSQENEDRISSENVLVFTYTKLLNESGINIDYNTSEEIIIDITNRINNGDVNLEKLMNIAFYVYAYGKISNAKILEKLSGALYIRQFDKEKEYGMYIEGLRIIETYGRQRAQLEKIKMELSSINDKVELSKQELEEANIKVEEANAILKVLATTDELTQVKNRTSFDSELGEFISLVGREKANLVNAVVMFDIDNFKKFNDNYGHVIGDEVLKIFAGTINNKIRQTDKFFRYGGEEFSMLISCNTQENLHKTLDELRMVISKIRYPYKSRELKVTVSIGYALLDKESINKDVNFVDLADKALYYSKENGRNQVTKYSEKLDK